MLYHERSARRPRNQRPASDRPIGNRSFQPYGRLWRSTLGVVSLVLLISSVTPVAYAAKLVEYQKKQQFVDEVPEGLALIYFYRPQANVGINVIPVFIDEQFVGITKGNTYVFATVEPGKHVLWAKSFNTAAIEVEVEAGRTYYVRIREAAAMFSKSRARLALPDATKAATRIRRCAYVLPTPAGEARGAELISTHWQKARANAKASG